MGKMERVGMSSKKRTWIRDVAVSGVFQQDGVVFRLSTSHVGLSLLLDAQSSVDPSSFKRLSEREKVAGENEVCLGDKIQSVKSTRRGVLCTPDWTPLFPPSPGSYTDSDGVLRNRLATARGASKLVW